MHNRPMGAWGTDPFDNDDAADFSASVRGTAGAEALADSCATTCSAVLTEDGVELGTAAEAIAAAVVVGVAAGADDALVSSPYGPGAGACRLLAQLPAAQFGALRALAATALDRIFDERDNEWYDEWQDSGELDDIRSVLEPVRAALRR